MVVFREKQLPYSLFLFLEGNFDKLYSSFWVQKGRMVYKFTDPCALTLLF